MSYRPYDHDSTFMYLYHFISIDLESSRSCNSTHCKAYSYEPGLHYLLNTWIVPLDCTTCWTPGSHHWIALPAKPSIYYLIQEVTTSSTFAVSRASSSTKRTDDWTSIVLNIEYRILNIKYRTSNIKYRTSNIEHRKLNINRIEH